MGDVVMAVRPVVRALFLQGHRTLSINFALGAASGESTVWRSLAPPPEGDPSLDPQAFVVSDEWRSFDRPNSGLNIGFELADIGDAHGPARNGYAMPSPTEVIGIDEPLATNGKVPAALERVVEDYVDSAADALAALLPDVRADPPRGDHQGVLWIFDPGWWFGLPDAAVGVAVYALSVLRMEGADFIRGQVFDDSRKHDPKFLARRRSPSLEWLYGRIEYPVFEPAQFWSELALALQGRGEAHHLTMADRQRLPNVAWLDAIFELMAIGAIGVDGLIEPAEPIEPLVSIAVDDENEQLVVWGEQSINLLRSTPLLYKRSLAGSVAWDYVYGDAGNKPRVVVVASRGIEIGTAWDESFPWVLDIIRVQDDTLVPSEGEQIDPATILTASLHEPLPGERAEQFGEVVPVWTGMYPRVAVKPKRDGLYFEFPVWGQSVTGVEGSIDEEAVGLGTAIPFGLELTLDDPRSGHDGYIVDIHYYTANAGANATGGAHICVWATEGVTIQSNGVASDGPSAATSQATHMVPGFAMPAWTASAEFWQVDRIEWIRRPFEGQLQITPRLTVNDDRIAANVGRFSDTASAIEYLDPVTHDVTWLTFKPYAYKNFHYEDSILFDVLDMAFGFIPFVGDVADIAECAYAWTTGYDKWGRPVSNFGLAMMTIGAAVPLVSSAFVMKAGALVEASPDALLHGEELIFLLRRAAGTLGADVDDVEAALSVSATWQTDRRLTDTAAKKAMTRELLDFITKNPETIEAYAAKLIEGSGEEWLALPDILDDATGGFRITSMQTAYLSWCKTHIGTTPAQFIESGISGRAKVLAEALLGNEAVGGALRSARRTAKNTGYPSAIARRALGGVKLALAQINGEAVATQLVAYVRRVLTPGSRNMVVATQELRPVTFVVDHGEEFFEDGARVLLGKLDPKSPLSGVTGGVLEPLLGKDKLNGALVSLEERAARFADALFAAYAELKDKAIAVETLFAKDMLPVTRDFVRSFVARVGKENGSRFELRWAALIETELKSLVTAVSHQLKLPTLLKKLLLSGPDSVLYMDGRAFLVQLKSYARIEDLIDGPVTITKDAAGNIISVEGPSLIQQVIKDGGRLKHWNHKVPPPGVVWNELDPPADVSDWIDIGDVHALVIDDVFLRDEAFKLINDARKRVKGKRTVDIMADVDAPVWVRESLRRAVGDVVYPENVELLESRLQAWVIANAGDMEGLINAKMASPEVVAAVGRKLQFKVFLGSSKVTEIPEALRDAVKDFGELVGEGASLP
jgi:hypothetical protein